MNRPFDEELISAYLDDELSVEERRDVERILAERPEAQRLLDELRGIRDGLQALPAYRLQDDFGATVLRRAEREMLRSPAPTNEASEPTTAVPTVAGAVAVPPANNSPPTMAAATTDSAVTMPASTMPASTAERNWRRPAGWSLLAVAAALVLMFIERRTHEVGNVALLEKKTDTGNVSSSASPAAAGQLTRDGEKEVGAKHQTQADRADDGLLPAPQSELAKYSDAVGTNGGVMSKVGPSGGTLNNSTVVPLRKAGESSDLKLATTTPAPGNAMSVFNNPVPSGGQMAIDNVLPKNALPTVQGLTAPTSDLTAGGGNGVAGNGVLNGPLAAGQAFGGAGGTAGGGGVGGGFTLAPTTLQEQQKGQLGLNPLQAGQAAVGPAATNLNSLDLNALNLNTTIDVTPLIASNDYYRARSLVAEYDDVRKEVADEKLAVQAYSQRLRQTQDADADVRRNVQARSQSAYGAAPSDQLLIVQCDITPEALERGLAPILVRQNIADLTAKQTTVQMWTRSAAGDDKSRTLTEGVAPNAVATDPAQRETKRNVAELNKDREEKAAHAAAGEEFVYVVADAKQLEATLDALRRQPEFFVNVQVEPAPADARQQGWRSYSRGLPTEAGKPAAANETKKAEQAGAPAATIAQTELESAAVATSGKRAAEPNQYGGGATTAAPTSQAAAGYVGQQNLNSHNLYTQSLGQEAQSVAPLSRAQRLNRADFAAAPQRRNFESSQALAGAQPAGPPPAPTVSAPSVSTPSASTPTVLGDVAPGKNVDTQQAKPGERATIAAKPSAVQPTASQPAAVPPATSLPIIAQPVAPGTNAVAAAAPTATAPALPAAPNVAPAAAPAPLPAIAKVGPGGPTRDLAQPNDAPAPPANTADGGPVANRTDEARGLNLKGDAARAKSLTPADQPTADALKSKVAADAEPVWFGLPPDYHEALFIFRVVKSNPTGAPMIDAKPATKQ